MNTIKQILDTKGPDVWSIEPDATVYDAVRLMAEKEIGALMVMDDGKLVGVISERDYARQVILKGRASDSTQVKEIMTNRVVFGQPDQRIEECLGVMTQKHIRHLPIIHGDEVLGVLSLGDLVKAIISAQRMTIEQLERYISG